MKGKTFFWLFVSIMIYSCEYRVEQSRYYAHQLILENFDSSEINYLINRKKSTISDRELSLKTNYSQTMNFVDTIYVGKPKRALFVSKWNNDEHELIAYSTTDSIKLILIEFSSSDAIDIYILKDFRYEKLLVNLVDNDEFILNKIMW